MLKECLIEKIAIIEQKMFYKPPPFDVSQYNNKELLETSGKYNFDIPDAIDWDMLANAIDTLVGRKPYLFPPSDEKYRIM